MSSLINLVREGGGETERVLILASIDIFIVHMYTYIYFIYIYIFALYDVMCSNKRKIIIF